MTMNEKVGFDLPYTHSPRQLINLSTFINEFTLLAAKVVLYKGSDKGQIPQDPKKEKNNIESPSERSVPAGYGMGHIPVICRLGMSFSRS